MTEDARRAASGTVKYDPAFCRQVVDYMGQGYSLTAFAGQIGVSRARLDIWIKGHPLFAEAVERGRAARTRMLETGLLAAETGAKVSAHMLALKNAAPDDWREKRAAEPVNAAPPPAAELDLPDNGRD